MEKTQDIYSYVVQQENGMTVPVMIEDNMEWRFKDHVRRTILYKNSQYAKGSNNDSAYTGQYRNTRPYIGTQLRPYKNIIRPILNLQYRAEGFDVKDIEIFVDDADNYYKSFLIKKFHTKWARENDIDDFIDDMVESYVDFGAALVKKTSDIKPEVVPLQNIAFCDQTDFLSGPFAIKHFFNPTQLRKMADKGWGNSANGATMSIEELIILGENKKQRDKTVGRMNQTPGKYLEIYEVHGDFPKAFLEGDDFETYSLQMHIIGFYTDKHDMKHGVTLFKGKQKELPFKLLLRDKIQGRALGLGGAEELFQPQIWVNYGQIRVKEMLDAAAMTIHVTDDPGFVNRNANLTDVENNQVLDIEQGKTVKQLDTFPRNAASFDNNIAGWEAHAQQMGAANDAIQGISPKSGTPFKLQELVVQQSQGLHEYRKGKIAAFLDEIYHDWLMSGFVKEVTKGQEFLTELDLDDLNEVRDKTVDNAANNMVKERIINGQLISQEEIEAFKLKSKEEFSKGGNMRFIKILKDELKDVPVSVRINIIGKQEYMQERVSKLVNVFRQILAAPQVLQDPNMAKLFNAIISSSGLDPIDFAGFSQAPQQLPQGTPQQGSPELTPPIQ